MLCAGAVLVTANDIAGVVDPECLGLHRVGKIELGEPAVGAPHKAMLNARSRGGERTTIVPAWLNPTAKVLVTSASG